MAYENILFDWTLVAAEDLSAKQYTVVKTDSAGKAASSTAGSAVPTGIVQDKPTAGQTAQVRVLGISKAVAGGTVASGAAVTAGTGGKVTAATNGDYAVGIALVGGAANEIITILLTGPFKY